MSETKKLNLRETVTVYATAKNPNATTGTAMHMGKLAAEFALKNGYATKEAPAKTKKAE